MLKDCLFLEVRFSIGVVVEPKDNRFEISRTGRKPLATRTEHYKENLITMLLEVTHFPCWSIAGVVLQLLLPRFETQQRHLIASGAITTSQRHVVFTMWPSSCGWSQEGETTFAC
jgi:hypothetical protein